MGKIRKFMDGIETVDPNAQIQNSSFHCKCQKKFVNPIQNWLVILQRFSILTAIIQAPSFIIIQAPSFISVIVIFHVLH